MQSVGKALLNGRLQENLCGQEARGAKAELSAEWQDGHPCEQLRDLVPGRGTAGAEALRWGQRMCSEDR